VFIKTKSNLSNYFWYYIITNSKFEQLLFLGIICFNVKHLLDKNRIRTVSPDISGLVRFKSCSALIECVLIFLHSFQKGFRRFILCSKMRHYIRGKFVNTSKIILSPEPNNKMIYTSLYESLKGWNNIFRRSYCS